MKPKQSADLFGHCHAGGNQARNRGTVQRTLAFGGANDSFRRTSVLAIARKFDPRFRISLLWGHFLQCFGPSRSANSRAIRPNGFNIGLSATPIANFTSTMANVFI